MNQRLNRILRIVSVLVLLGIGASMIIGAFLTIVLAYRIDTVREHRQVEQMTSSVTPLPVTPETFRLGHINLWDNLPHK